MTLYKRKKPGIAWPNCGCMAKLWMHSFLVQVLLTA